MSRFCGAGTGIRRLTGGWRLLPGAVALVGLAGASDAHAQWLAVRELGGQLGGEAYSWRTSVRSVFSQTAIQAREWVSVGIQGHVYHPRLATFHARLSPTWFQNGLRDSTESAGDATAQLDYELGLHALSNNVVSFGFTATRLNGTLPRVLTAGRGRDVGRLHAYVRLNTRALPTQLTFERRSVAESRTGDEFDLPLSDYVTDRLWLRAANSKLNLNGMMRNFRNQLSGSERRQLQADLTHRFEWGRGSKLLTRAAILSLRNGESGTMRRWSENLRIRHTATISSQTRFQLSGTSSGGRTSSGRLAGFGLEYNARGLRVAARGDAVKSSTIGATQSYYRVDPNLGYTVGLPLEAVLSIHGSVAYEWASVETINGLLAPVVAERHVVDQSERFTLAERFAEPTSVVVVDWNRQIVYDPELDYRLQELGDVLEVVVLPQGRIAVGDTLSVSYEYHVLETGDHRGLAPSYSARLSRNGLSVFVRQYWRSPAEDGSLSQFREINNLTAGLSYTGRLGRLAPTGSAEYRRSRYNGTDLTTYLLLGALSMRLNSRIDGSLGGSLRFARSSNINSDNLTARLTLGWLPFAGMRIRGNLMGWWWRDMQREREFRLGTALRADYRIGATVLSGGLRYQLRRDGRVWENLAATLRLTRDF